MGCGLAEGVSNGGTDADPARLLELGRVFGPRGLAAVRRIASLAYALETPFPLVPSVESRQPMIRLDPGDDHTEWLDLRFRVAWNVTVDELRAVVEQ
jgi:hypothetical protein